MICCLGFAHGASIVFICILLLQLEEAFVECHGRLMEPPARNSMWRFGFANPVDYNDNELYCGGYSVQWSQNGGKCGICGDAYNAKDPKPHEAGGEFGRGIITRHYFAGQVIDIVVELTSNHRGRFELYLCPNNNPKREASQNCFDRYPLYIQGSRDVRYVIPPDSAKKEIFYYKVRLPPYLTCSQCVLQWTYYTANTWGTCGNGTEGLGCGQVETFRNCADVRIASSSSGLPPQFVNELGYAEMYREQDSKNGPILSYPNIVQRVLRKKKKKVITEKNDISVAEQRASLKKRKKVTAEKSYANVTERSVPFQKMKKKVIKKRKLRKMRPRSRCRQNTTRSKSLCTANF